MKASLVVPLLILLSMVAYSVGSVNQANTDQLTIFQYRQAQSAIPFVAAKQVNVSGLYAESGTTAKLTVTVHRVRDLFPDPAMLAKGYTPDCSSFCWFGISYIIDPTVVITNGGRNFEQCKVFGSAGTGDGSTCTAADLAQYLSVSVSTAYTPLVTDTACHATVATTNGFSIAVGTITAGAAGTTVTTTISKTWTAATSGTSNIDLACIQTEAGGGGNIILYAEGQIASTSVNVGDSLTTQWTVART